MLFTMTLSRFCLLSAGVLLAFHTLMGLLLAIFLDVALLSNAIKASALTLGFFLYLLSFHSIRLATAAVWLFFAYQWIISSLFSHNWGSPFDWPYGVALFTSACLMQVGYLTAARATRSGHRLTLADVFSPVADAGGN